MRLLVTRPAANAVVLAEKLATQGHDVVISPVIEIYPTDTPLPDNQAGGFAALALTSANGVQALAAKLAACARPEDWRHLPAYSVGPQTATALKAYGWADVRQADGDVEALARLIATTHKRADGAVLHVAGRDRAGDLAAALRAANIECRLANLYVAEPAEALSPAAAAALADTQEPVDGVLLYSQRSAKLFLALTQSLTQSLILVEKPTAFCLSPVIGEMMHAAGYATKIAATPDEAGMLALTAQ